MPDGLTPAATRPWIAQAVDWAFDRLPPPRAKPPSRSWVRRRYTLPWRMALRLPPAAATPWSAAPVLSASLGALFWKPHPPSRFSAPCSHLADRRTEEREAP